MKRSVLFVLLLLLIGHKMVAQVPLSGNLNLSDLIAYPLGTACDVADASPQKVQRILSRTYSITDHSFTDKDLVFYHYSIWPDENPSLANATYKGLDLQSCSYIRSVEGDIWNRPFIGYSFCIWEKDMPAGSSMTSYMNKVLADFSRLGISIQMEKKTEKLYVGKTQTGGMEYEVRIGRDISVNGQLSLDVNLTYPNGNVSLDEASSPVETVKVVKFNPTNSALENSSAGQLPKGFQYNPEATIIDDTPVSISTSGSSSHSSNIRKTCHSCTPSGSGRCSLCGGHGEYQPSIGSKEKIRCSSCGGTGNCRSCGGDGYLD